MQIKEILCEDVVFKILQEKKGMLLQKLFHLIVARRGICHFVPNGLNCFKSFFTRQFNERLCTFVL